MKRHFISDKFIIGIDPSKNKHDAAVIDPKNRSLGIVDPQEVEFVKDRLNNRPRKILKYRSPNEFITKSVAIET